MNTIKCSFPSFRSISNSIGTPDKSIDVYKRQGLGYDGHFCGNCPRCTPFDSYTYQIDFKEKQAVNPDYKDRPYQPFTLTMGPKSLMRVKHLVMIVNGKEKAEIFKRFLDEPINQDVPATILKLHPNFTVICDQDAASLIHYEQYSRL